MCKNESALDRLILIMGEERVSILSRACVCVLGLGGVGSSCAEALARGGIGRLIPIDRDVVAPSNINRQALAFTSTLGQPKATVMHRMVKDINPEAEVWSASIFLEKNRIDEQMSEYPRPDYVVDAIDTVSQKLAVAQWCSQEQIPLVSSMGGANKLDPTRLRFSRIENTHGDALARIVRKECRKRGIRNLQVLYSDESSRPVATPAGTHEGGRPAKGETLGTMSYYPPIMGQMLASRVIRDLVGL